MSAYVCPICGYVYEEEKGAAAVGIPPSTTWERLPDDWSCPLCGASKDVFRKLQLVPQGTQLKNGGAQNGK